MTEAGRDGEAPHRGEEPRSRRGEGGAGKCSSPVTSSRQDDELILHGDAWARVGWGWPPRPVLRRRAAILAALAQLDAAGFLTPAGVGALAAAMLEVALAREGYGLAPLQMARADAVEEHERGQGHDADGSRAVTPGEVQRLIQEALEQEVIRQHCARKRVWTKRRAQAVRRACGRQAKVASRALEPLGGLRTLAPDRGLRTPW